jgi:hypothetical protein
MMLTIAGVVLRYFTLNQEFGEAVNDGILIHGSDSSDHFNYVTYHEEAEPYEDKWTMRGIIDSLGL